VERSSGSATTHVDNRPMRPEEVTQGVMRRGHRRGSWTSRQRRDVRRDRQADMAASARSSTVFSKLRGGHEEQRDDRTSRGVKYGADIRPNRQGPLNHADHVHHGRQAARRRRSGPSPMVLACWFMTEEARVEGLYVKKDTQHCASHTGDLRPARQSRKSDSIEAVASISTKAKPAVQRAVNKRTACLAWGSAC